MLSCGVFFFGMLLLCAAVVYWSQRSATYLQQRFFTAVTSGRPERVEELFTPALRGQVDRPVLAAWMDAVNANLGTFRRFSRTDFHTSIEEEAGVKVTASKGTVLFEKGSARSELVFHDGRLMSFSVESAAIPPDWLREPIDTQLYRERGRQFLAYVLSENPDAAFAMMHESLRDVFPLGKLKAMIAENAPAGELRSITYEAEARQADKGHDLRVFYRVSCENAQGTAAVVFQFVGMKGHILAFDLDARR